MFDESLIIGAKFDRNATVADFIKHHKGTQFDCFDLFVNGKIIPRCSLMRDAVKVKIQERQVNFDVRHNCRIYPIVFGLSKTIKSLKEHLRDDKNIVVDHHTFIFNGNNLNDDATLNECKIVDNSVLDLVSKCQLISLFKYCD